MKLHGRLKEEVHGVVNNTTSNRSKRKLRKCVRGKKTLQKEERYFSGWILNNENKYLDFRTYLE